MWPIFRLLMPTLGFVVQGKVLNLQPDDYIDRNSDGCSLALMALDVPPPKGPIFVFGDPFLRRFLTVYDRDGPSVGFAVAQQENLGPAEIEASFAAVKPAEAGAIIRSDAAAFGVESAQPL